MIVRVPNLLLVLAILGGFNFVPTWLVDAPYFVYQVLTQRVFFLVLFSIYLVINVKRLMKLHYVSSLLIIINIFWILRIIQSLFTPDIVTSIFKSVEVFIYFNLVLILYYKYQNPKKEVYKNLFWTYFCVIAMSTFTALLFPRYGLNEAEVLFQIRGVFPNWNSNGLAQCVALLLLSYVYLRRSVSSLKILVYLLLMSLLVLAQTRSVILPFMLLYVYLSLKCEANLLKKLTYIYMILLSTVIGVLFVDSLLSYLYRGQDLSLLLSFSGRVLSWSYTIDFIKDNVDVFFFGLGPYVGYKELLGPIAFENLNQGIALATLDNSYIELLVNSGFIMFILFLVILLKIFIKLSHIDDTRFRAFVLCAFAFVIIRSVFVSSLLLPSNLFFLLSCVVAISVDVRKTQRGQRRPTERLDFEFS